MNQKKYESNKRYNDKTYRNLAFSYRKEDPLFDLLDIASKKTKQSKAEYTRQALYSRFIQDGIMKSADQDEEFNKANSSSGLEEQTIIESDFLDSTLEKKSRPISKDMEQTPIKRRVDPIWNRPTLKRGIDPQ